MQLAEAGTKVLTLTLTRTLTLALTLTLLALRASGELATPSSFLLSIFLEFGTGTRIVGRVRTPILLA